MCKIDINKLDLYVKSYKIDGYYYYKDNMDNMNNNGIIKQNNIIGIHLNIFMIIGQSFIFID